MATSSEFFANKNKLDWESERHGDLVYKYAEELANAKAELEDLKLVLEIERAELDKDIRADPEAWGIGKITEEAVRTTILLQTVIKKLTRKINKAKHHVDIVQAALTALEAKRRSMDNLVSLHGQQYFASSSSHGVSSDDGEGQRQKASKGLMAKTAKQLKKEAEEEDE